MDKNIEKIISIIDSHKDEIIEFGRDIFDHSETGYKEFRTTEKFQEKMKELGLPIENGLAITGAKAYLNKDKAENISLGVLGEMDALIIPEQAHADPVTGAAHCCGHHAQITAVYGAALALTVPEIAELLDGQVVFFGIPAEEYIEIGFRNGLIEEGKIKYGAGKAELIAEGAFEDIDLSVCHHTGEGIQIGTGSANGFVPKAITYIGKSAHAGAEPFNGVNALSAASLGLQAIGLNRETFKDADSVRVHPIITKGGKIVNAVPDEVTLETHVRAKRIEGISDAVEKVDRSLMAGAIAMGAGLRIETTPGHLPSPYYPTDKQIFNAVKEVYPEAYEVDPAFHNGGTTDVGDLQHMMPVMTFHTCGKVGLLHSPEFDIVDDNAAYVDAAKIFAIHVYELLKDGAALAKKIKSEYKPAFATKEEYTAYIETFNSTKVIELGQKF